MKSIVVLTGAGISAESGINTFRSSTGLWENHRIEDVASPEGWERNPELVLQFYNERRKEVMSVLPNLAHKALVNLEDKFLVNVITQNIDDLHERSGSKNILHLHGEILEARSIDSPHLIYKLDSWELKLGDKGRDGAQLRPNIVWFGEAVPMMDIAIQTISKADIVIIIGTSLVVYPAASIIDYIKLSADKYLIDPSGFIGEKGETFTVIRENATIGVPKLVSELLKK